MDRQQSPARSPLQVPCGAQQVWRTVRAFFDRWLRRDHLAFNDQNLDLFQVLQHVVHGLASHLDQGRRRQVTTRQAVTNVGSLPVLSDTGLVQPLVPVRHPRFVLGQSTARLRELEISTSARDPLPCSPPSSDTTRQFPKAARLPGQSPRCVTRSPVTTPTRETYAPCSFGLIGIESERVAKTLRARFHMVRAAGGHPENVPQLPPLPPTQPRRERPSQQIGCPPATVPDVFAAIEPIVYASTRMTRSAAEAAIFRSSPVGLDVVPRTPGSLSA